jgi:predicted nucleic acid-binding protein
LVIVDSTVWIDYLGNRDTLQTDWLSRALNTQRLGLLDLILCEVLQGIRDEQVVGSVNRALQEFEVFSSGGVELAVASAANYRQLRRRGITIRKTIDCLIATYCIRQGYLLLHSDTDFNPFEEHLGLAVIHPRTN